MTGEADRLGLHPLRRFAPYAAYKDTGVQWLGAIPVHWEVKPLKTALIRNDSGVWGDDFDEDGSIVLRSTEQTADGRWKIAEPARRRLSARDAASARLSVGDLIVTKSSGSADHIGKTTIVDTRIAAMKCCYSNFMQRLRVSADHVPRFFWYFMNSRAGREQLVMSSSTTTGLGNLNGSILASTNFPLAPPAEQRAVANFLDRETAKIDALVAKKERLIELRREKRTALITRAVTRGLDPNVPMKDSGVEWLGDIPAHWEVKKTKFAAALRSGHTPSRQKAEYWKDCTIPWFGLADVWQIRDGHVEEVHETAEKISEIGLVNSAANLLPMGTVILSRTASVGFSAVLGVDMATTQDFVNWTCGPTLQPTYLLYVFRAMRPELRRLTMGSTHQTIYMPDVARFSTPVPPLLEQDRIVGFIRKETTAIDTLLTKIGQAIDLLNELRTALISAAVTGKIDVRQATTVRGTARTRPGAPRSRSAPQ